MGCKVSWRSGKRAQHNLKDRWNYRDPEGTTAKDGEPVTSWAQQKGLRGLWSYLAQVRTQERKWLWIKVQP